MKVISRHSQKKDFSGQCKAKEWGFVKGGEVFWGYTSKKSAVDAAAK